VLHGKIALCNYILNPLKPTS